MCRTRKEWPPLLLAVQGGDEDDEEDEDDKDEDTFKILIGLGADATIRNNNGYNSLHLAIIL